LRVAGFLHASGCTVGNADDSCCSLNISSMILSESPLTLA
jgi:hypothetical protein